MARFWPGAWRSLAILAMAGFFALNAGAWLRARAMTHYSEAGAPLATMSPPDRARLLLMGAPVPRPRNQHTPADVGLAYTTHRIELGDGEWLEAWSAPHPRPRGLVALFHGYAMSKESLLPRAVILCRLGFSGLLVDFRGSGGSSGTTTTLGLREADDVVAVARYAERAWPGEPLVFYGVSMGASAVMRAVAVAGLQPAALILESPFDRLLTTVRRRVQAMPLPASPAAELLLFWGGAQQGFDGFTHNPVEYAAAARCPSLLLYGGGDPWIAATDVEAVAARLGGPREVVMLPSTGHDLLAVAAPESWRREVAGFLDRASLPE